MKKIVVTMLMAMSLVATNIPSANASIWGGACTLSLEFFFNSPVRATATAPSYSVDASGSTCTSSADLSRLVFQTFGGGNGSSILWSCDATAAEGSWSQGFSSGLPPVGGSHVITGTDGAWVLVALDSDLTFAGIAELTVAPSDATKLATCHTSGMSSIAMTGVMEFVDP